MQSILNLSAVGPTLKDELAMLSGWVSQFERAGDKTTEPLFSDQHEIDWVSVPLAANLLNLFTHFKWQHTAVRSTNVAGPCFVHRG